jgi:cellulose synthase/poly-beta-1,6-N-acetylglucosamine synthase-like glycosyltransferase
MIIAQLFFWFCVLALAHSYVIYPLVMQFIVFIRGAKKYEAYRMNDELPVVTIMIAAYNEELVIEKKIRSIFNTIYPLYKIQLLVGSDNSSDNTNVILQKLANEFHQLSFTHFKERQGKISIINQLSDLATGELLIVSDANVMLEQDTLFQLVKYFKDSQVGLVDTNMKNYGIKKNGISFQEKSYISHEVNVKHLESISFGTMIGPFGGCYAVRKNLFTKVPLTFFVDDFFICMSVLAMKKKTINNIDATVYEDVSNLLALEFKRKIRIAIGNFQNLKYFRRLLANPFNSTGFCFLSHKVLRWFGPFFILGAFITNILLLNHFAFYSLLFIFQLFITILPIVDLIFKKFGIHIVFLRFATHFYTMNLSMLIGFIKSLKGVKSNVWKPTKRLQG